MVSTLAVLVHHDPHGELAHHVRFALRQLRPAASRLVFVTTAQLSPQSRGALSLADEVIERPNRGYDFGSWQAGLLSQPGWSDYDQVILANDCVVGPLVPVAQILAARRAEAYGITISPQYLDHLQSSFMVFGARVIGDPYFRAFWESMPPLDDRERVIADELGLARLLADLGYGLGAYFVPSPLERRIGSSRSLRAIATRGRFAGAARGMLRPVPVSEHDPRRGAFSPIEVLWDRALSGALPVVKVSHFTSQLRDVDALRRDLARLTARYPEAFEGFAAYVARVGGPSL